MKVLKYQNLEYPIKTTEQYNFLFSHEDLSNIFFVYEYLLSETIHLNPSYLYENVHYSKIEEKIFWTKSGIIRAGILIGCDESLNFADFIENDRTM